ncbi:MAG: DEAD/DEAH box helicase family protein [Sandaracinaceae bacterium]|nr:DEAD/DEAH box helicase family protein [Sandaracinaceae bacterium]
MRDGAPLELEVRREVFTPYAYQEDACRAFLDAGSHGVVVLPCGAGKTVLAMMAIAALRTHTLVMTSSREACSQWRRELLAKTTLAEDDVVVYDAKQHAIGPLTLTTYSMMARKAGSGPTGHVHFDRLGNEPWGLVVYDEVHLLPAPMFRLTAEMQARRRLGLTATLVREDGRAGDVFALDRPQALRRPVARARGLRPHRRGDLLRGARAHAGLARPRVRRRAAPRAAARGGREPREAPRARGDRAAARGRSRARARHVPRLAGRSRALCSARPS